MYFFLMAFISISHRLRHTTSAFLRARTSAHQKQDSVDTAQVSGPMGAHGSGNYLDRVELQPRPLHFLSFSLV